MFFFVGRWQKSQNGNAQVGTAHVSQNAIQRRVSCHSKTLNAS